MSDPVVSYYHKSVNKGLIDANVDFVLVSPTVEAYVDISAPASERVYVRCWAKDMIRGYSIKVPSQWYRCSGRY